MCSAEHSPFSGLFRLFLAIAFAVFGGLAMPDKRTKGGPVRIKGESSLLRETLKKFIIMAARKANEIVRTGEGLSM